jgi:fucose permease
MTVNMIKYINTITKELFYVLTGALIIFIILEIVWPGVVLAYININLVLIFWLAVGIVILLTSHNA